MELPRRLPDDVYLPEGAFEDAIKQLRQYPDAHNLRIGIVYAYDQRTWMLPYWHADGRMAPCSVRTLADVLHSAGFKHLRVVLQQWTPNFRPSAAKLEGEPLDILLVSAMQVHAEPAYDLIRDAYRMGSRRPLILVGGPKAIYEPTDYFDLGPVPGIDADCVVTGEAFVLLNLLLTLLDNRRAGEHPRKAFDRCRRGGDLNNVPGLVYLSPDSHADQLVAINTGVQRLLRNLDEMPMPDAGYRLIEAPHRGRGLRNSPLAAHKVRLWSPIASLISTQGCKFNCSYCPIPAVNQRTWRHKSAQRLAAEVKHIHEAFGIDDFFSTDDNFFNRRETVVDLMTELARTTTNGQALGERIKFYTEATQFDVYKNRDILPLCRKGGLRAIWFGIEDMIGELVNKGQKKCETADLFTMMHGLGIEPMAMMIHSDDQPLRSKSGDLNGLLDQARHLFKLGAVSYQCTYLAPAVGTRDIEEAAKARKIYRRVGGKPIPQAFQDGNHVVSSANPQPWRQQVNVLRAYATFYNPVNMLRTLLAFRGDSVTAKRLIFQLVGQFGLAITAPKLLGWAQAEARPD